ncbi:MAG: hypoxanthine-guanine phosphoribosyltransferase [Pseudomonadota bacterium]
MPDLNHLLPEGSKIIHSAEAVAAAYDTMAQELNERYASADSLLVLTIMNGAMLPAAELISRLTMDVRMDYLHATRYHDEQGGDRLRWLATPRTQLAGERVLIVDDILDEGFTLDGVIRHCREAGAQDVSTAVLVQKLHDRCLPGVEADVCGLTVPDVYVFGCGMDYRGRLRHLDAIYGLNA